MKLLEIERLRSGYGPITALYDIDLALDEGETLALIGASARTALLAHERKFPGTGAVRICTLEDVDTLITTEGNTSEELLRRRESGRKVIVA